MSELSTEQRDAIIEDLYAGRKIAAIKVYRQATGAGLKEAKEFIDELQARLRQEQPDRFQTPKSGCAGVVLLLTVAGLGIAAAHLVG